MVGRASQSSDAFFHHVLNFHDEQQHSGGNGRTLAV
jgi:hypothetical protein